jgi:hypothetical protein
MAAMLGEGKPADAAKVKKYLMDAKVECGDRLLNTVLFHPEHDDMDLKYWIPYGKKNFLGLKFNDKKNL